MRGFIFSLAVLLVAGASARASGEAPEFRNITSFTLHDYSNAASGRTFEDAFIAKVRPGASLVLKAYRDDRRTWAKNIYTLGATFVTGGYDYAEFDLGFGRDSAKEKSRYYAFEYTREKPRYIAAAGYRHAAEPGYHANVISPSLKWNFMPRASVFAKYFYAFDSDSNSSGTLWMEAAGRVSDKLTFKAGFTTGGRMIDNEYGRAAEGSFHSYILGLDFALKNNATLKYIFENLHRDTQARDKKNTLVIDLKF
ncbi:MAG TPA: hypothetical protein PLQ76_04010 [bacterium]|nr:hypothetical protein [bacterium]